MEESWIDPAVWVVLGVISLGALATSVGLVFKAFSFQNQYSHSVLIGLVGTAVFTAAGLLAPLALFSGQDHQQDHLLADVLMYGISGLVVVGILCFIVDHLNERPSFLILAAAASFAVVIFPWIYLAFSSKLNDQFRITIVQPSPLAPSGLDPLIGDRGTLDSAANDGNAQEDEAGAQPPEATIVFSPFSTPPATAPSKSQETPTSNSTDAATGSSTDWLYDDP